MSEPYHYWKIKAAVEGLAAGEAPLRTRIQHALISMAVLKDGDFPPAVLDTWHEIKAHVEWKRDADPQEGIWAGTLNAMSDADARKVAELIVLLFELTARTLGRATDD